MTLWHITTRAALQAALREGEYRAPSLATEGFVHLSTSAQWLRTANRFYRGVPDAIRLALDEARLESPVRFELAAHPAAAPGAPGVDAALEPRAGEELFPHLYGPLPLAAITAVYAFVIGPDGEVLDAGEPEPLPTPAGT